MTDRKPSDCYTGASDPQLKISKWQKASVDITNLKFKLGNILDGFTPEERDSKKYEELIQTVDILFDHVLGSHKEKLNKKTETIIRDQILQDIKQNENVIFTPKTAVIVVSSAILYKLLEKAIIFLLTF